MSNKSPVFPMPTGAKMPQSHHFSDYGFDPQIGYVQVLEEAKMRRRVNNDDNDLSTVRSVDSLHFKLQKPIARDESNKQKKAKYWWRNVMLFLRRRLVQGSRPRDPYEDEIGGIEQIRCRGGPYVGSLSGPLYLTESRSGSSTPYRSSNGPASRMLTPARSTGDVEIPYISLRELNMEAHHELYKGTTNSAMPIYLVT